MIAIGCVGAMLKRCGMSGGSSIAKVVRSAVEEQVRAKRLHTCLVRRSWVAARRMLQFRLMTEEIVHGFMSKRWWVASGKTMSILTDKERAAVQAVPLGRERVRRAEALVNPTSGLANDYLNLFNEIVMLVEQLPNMPELFDDIQRWRPVSYREYFRQSTLPGRTSAIQAYDQLDARFRRDFEVVVAELDRRATGAVAAVRKHFKSQDQTDPYSLMVICERAGATIREALDKATMLVNHGTLLASDMVQDRTDRLFARAVRARPIVGAA